MKIDKQEQFIRFIILVRIRDFRTCHAQFVNSRYRDVVDIVADNGKL